MYKKTPDCQAGFTMVELMVTMAISAIIIAAIYSSYKFQRDTFEAQDQVTEMQQNARIALWHLTNNIRMAGYDPSGDAGAKIEDAEYTYQLSFTSDLNGDGDTDDSNEYTTFGFSNVDDPDNNGVIAGSGAASLGRDGGGAPLIFNPISEDIVAVEFNYILEDGTETKAPTSFQKTQIRAVEISLLARAGAPDRNFSNDNMTFKTASDVTWGPYNDNYRRLLTTTMVQFRNLGL